MRKCFKITGRKIQPAKNNRGMTMVEVIMGFALLAIVLGMISRMIVMSSNMYYNTVDLRNVQEALQKEIYLKNITDTARIQSATIRLYPEGTDHIAVNAIPMEKSKLYMLSSSGLPDTDAAEMDINLYFIASDDTEEAP